MAYIIPKVFSSDTTPDQLISLVTRSGNNDTIHKIIAVAMSSSAGSLTLNDTANGNTLVDRWVSLVNSNRLQQSVASDVFNTTPDGLAALPNAKYDAAKDVFEVAGMPDIPFSECNPAKLYIGAVVQNGQIKAVVDDATVKNVVAAKKRQYRKFQFGPQGDEIKKAIDAMTTDNSVAKRMNMVSHAMTNVSTVERNGVRVPRVPFVNNKNLRYTKHFDSDDASPLGETSFKFEKANDVVFVVFTRDYNAFKNTLELRNRMFTVSPNKVAALKTSFVGASMNHDTLENEVRQAMRDNIISSTIGNKIISTLQDTSKYHHPGGIITDENGKKQKGTYQRVSADGKVTRAPISSYLVEIKFDSDEMQALFKVFSTYGLKYYIKTDKSVAMSNGGQDDDGMAQRTKNGSGEASEGAVAHAAEVGYDSDSEETESGALQLGYENGEEQTADIASDMIKEVKNQNSILNDESKTVITNILNLYSRLPDFGASHALFSDPIFVKNAKFLCGGAPEKYEDLDITDDEFRSANDKVCNMVTGVIRALLSYNNGEGWSFFDASKVKVDNCNGVWFISDWGLTPEAMAEYEQYKERGKKDVSEHTQTSSKEDRVPDTNQEFEDEFIGLLLSEMYDEKHRPNGVSGPIKALVKNEIAIANHYGNTVDETPNIHGITLSQVLDSARNAFGADGDNPMAEDDAWDVLLEYPKVNLKNTLDEVLSKIQQHKLSDNIVWPLAVSLLSLRTKGDMNTIYTSLFSKDFRALLQSELPVSAWRIVSQSLFVDAKTHNALAIANTDKNGIASSNKWKETGKVLYEILLNPTNSVFAATFIKYGITDIHRAVCNAVARYALGDRVIAGVDTDKFGTSQDLNEGSRTEANSAIKQKIMNSSIQNVLRIAADKLYSVKYPDAMLSPMVGNSKNAIRKTAEWKQILLVVDKYVTSKMSSGAGSKANLIKSALASIKEIASDEEVMYQINTKMDAIETMLDNPADENIPLMSLQGTLSVIVNKRTISLGSVLDKLISMLANVGDTPMSELFSDVVNKHDIDELSQFIGRVEKAVGGNANTVDGGKNFGIIDFGFDPEKLTNMDADNLDMGFGKKLHRSNLSIRQELADAHAKQKAGEDDETEKQPEISFGSGDFGEDSNEVIEDEF